MYKQLYAAYSATDQSNPFGRKMIGYAGWHTSANEALKEAEIRFPEWIGDIQVNVA